MINEGKAEQLIIKLIRETSSGKVEWSLQEPPKGLVEATEDVVPLYLQTNYKNKLIGVYQKRSRHYVDEVQYCWVEGVGFCIVDAIGRVVWEFDDRSPALNDLLNTAREQASGIGDLLDDLLDE